MRLRGAERRASGLPPPSSLVRSTVEAADGVFSPAQCDAIRTVASQVARSLAVPSDAVSPPDATVQMLASDTLWSHEPRAGLRVEVALHDGTQPPEFEGLLPTAPLTTLEAVAYDQRVPCQRRKGDWKRMLAMNVRM